MLTPLQQKALQVIAAYQDENGGESPSLRDITGLLNLSSKSGAHRLLVSLEERGAIRRLPYLWRAIEITRRDLLRKPIPIYRAEDNQLMGYLP